MLVPGRAAAGLEGTSTSSGQDGTFASASTGSASPTGGATTAITFQLPPARGRAQPSLGLRYNSSSTGMGEAGVGWSLSTPPIIERRSQSGAPRFDNDDFLTVDGERLVPTWARPNCYAVEFRAPTTVYCPLWLNNSWTVYSRAGLTVSYNTTDADPQGNAYRWYPDVAYDVEANRVIYRWQTQGGLNQILGLSDRKYLTDIFDTAKLGAPLETTSHYAHHTRLVWEHHDFHAARYAHNWLRSQHELRLARVDVSSHSEHEAEPRQLLRRYRLRYTTSPVRNRSFLVGVQMEGRCMPAALQETAEDQRIDAECATAVPMPWTEMTYSGSVPRAQLQSWALNGFCGQGAGNCDAITDPTSTTLFDINGDGLPDVVDPKDSRVYVNPGFTPYAGLSFAGRNLDRSALGLEAATQAGHGFVSSTSGMTLPGYWGNGARSSLLWRTNRTGGNAREDEAKLVVPGFHPNQDPPFSLDVVGTIAIPKFDLVGDIDGDGLTDSLGRSRNPLPTPADDISYVQFSKFQPEAGPPRFASFVQKGPSNIQPLPLVGVNDPPFNTLADVNGDGVADLIVSTEQRAELGGARQFAYYPGRGDGQFGCTTEIEEAAGFTLPLLGSMCEDTPYVPAENAVLQGAKRIRLTSLPSYLPFSQTDHRPMFIDIDGDGLVDFLDATNDRLQLLINLDGHTFENACGRGYEGCDAQVLPLLSAFNFAFPANASTRISAADIDGNGTTEIIAISKNEVKVLSFDQVINATTTSRVRPGLLVSVTNNMGVRTSYEYYESLAHAALFASGQTPEWIGTSGALWHTFSEQPAQPLREVTVVTAEDTALPRTDRETYNYWDPAYDVWERRLVGFRRRSVSTLAGPLRNTSVTYSYFGDCELAVAEEIGVGGPVATRRSCAGTSRGTPDRLIRGMPYWTERGDGARVATATQFSYAAYFEGVAQVAPVGPPLFAAPSRTDTFIYDTSTFNPSTADIVVANVLTLGEELPRTVTIDRRDPVGRRHIAWSQVLDGRGLRVEAVQHGDVDEQDGEVRVAAEYDCGLPPNNWACAVRKTTAGGRDSTGTLGPSLVKEVTTRDPGFGSPKTVVVSHATTPVPLERAVPSGAPAPAAQGATFVAATYEYDALGNVVEATGPSFGTATGTASSCHRIHFDPTYGYFPLTRNICGSNVLRHDQTFDWVSGQLLTSLDEVTAHSRVDYDGYGRRVAEYGPDPDTGLPVLVADYEYHLGAGQPLQKVRARFYNDGGAYQEAWHYTDGLGRSLLNIRQADPWETPTGAAWIAEGQTYQSGADAYVHRPFPVDDPSAVALHLPYELVPGARLHYDEFGRLTETYYANQLTGRREYHGFKTLYWDRSQAGNSVAAQLESEVDGFGRVKQRTNREGATTVHSEFRYQHTHQVTRVFRWKADQSAPDYERWLQYDTFGRMVLNVEPNTSPNYQGPFGGAAPGLKAWRYVYDNAGHLVGTSDPRGCGKNILYDSLGRTVGEDYAPCEASHEPYSAPAGSVGLEVEHIYGNAQGDFGALLQTRDRGSDVSFERDRRGRVVRTNKRVAKPDAGASPWATRFADHEFSAGVEFDYAGRVVKRDTGADVPELLNIVGESWTKQLYSAAGAPVATESSYDLGATGKLLRQHHADAEGRPAETLYGDAGGTTVFRGFNSSEQLYTLVAVRTLAPAFWATGQGAYTAPAPAPQTYLLADIIYRDDRGNPSDVASMLDDTEWPAGAKPSRRRMEYDDLSRLKDVSYCYGFNCTPGVETDSFVSPFEKESSTGDHRPLPRQTAAHRPMSQHIDYDWRGRITGSSDDASMRFDRSIGAVLPPANAGPPDAIHDTDGGLHALYDDAGNMVELLVERGGFCPGGKCAHRFVYDWDEVGQLARARRWDYASLPVGAPVYPAVPVATPDWDLRYAYSGGQRVLKSAKDSTNVERHTLDVFDTLRVEHTSFDPQTNDYAVDVGTEVVYLDGFARVVYDPSLPSPSGNALHVFFTLGDAQGSATVVIDKETGEVVEKSSYMAFGAIESDYRPTRWASQREAFKYTGKEEDVEVGLTYFGARYYSPHLHQWISPDPLTIHGVSGDVNPYAFVQGNPQRYVDPLGLNTQEGQTSGGCLRFFCSTSGGGISGPGDLWDAVIDTFVNAWNDVFASAPPAAAAPRPVEVRPALDGLEGSMSVALGGGYTPPSWAAGNGTFPLSRTGTIYAPSGSLNFMSGASFIQGMWNGAVAIAMDSTPAARAAMLLGADPIHHLQFAEPPCPLEYKCDVGQVFGSFTMTAATALAGEFAMPAGAGGAMKAAELRGPASGASIVSPPGPGQVIRGSLARPVFEGHGTTVPGSFTVPEGTWLQVPNATVVSEAAGQSAAMNGTFPPGTATVYSPGTPMPNLVLHPPTPGMTVRPSSWQVTRPTMLRDMMEPNMGFCVWGACR